MNRTARMMLLNAGKDKEKERRRRMGVTYEDWTPQSHWGPYMPPYYDGGEMEPESAFYDRRGRRHYDDGRYAPMSVYGEPESARRYRRYSDGRFAPRSDYMPIEPWSGDRNDPYDDESPRMIGFGREWDRPDMGSDATIPRIVEMDRLRGQQSQHGRAYSNRFPKFDQRMATEWTRGMVNADGTKGPHWTMEETDRLHKQYGLDCDKLEFWAVMNSLYSDYCEALRESSASTPEVYVRLAKAWISDKDAVPDKAAAYYTYIVER